jgi:hypothetical protein
VNSTYIFHPNRDDIESYDSVSPRSKIGFFKQYWDCVLIHGGGGGIKEIMFAKFNGLCMDSFTVCGLFAQGGGG